MVILYYDIAMIKYTWLLGCVVKASVVADFIYVFDTAGIDGIIHKTDCATVGHCSLAHTFPVAPTVGLGINHSKVWKASTFICE